MKREGFSLQANAKTLEGAQHPHRDAQFRYLNEQVKDHQADGEPVVSVDTKKREHLGRLPMAGREWHPKGQPVKVEDHHFYFTGPDVEQAIPYGIYDLARNIGWVNVGVDHDTAVFAVESIRRWRQARGSLDYPQATRLLITADAGGSNGYRYRVWKSELAALAAETGLQVTVCHFPPGTSKWNKIEHRLFSHITLNWRGRPLTSHDVVVKTIAATTTHTGLRVEAALDPGDYPTGVAISKQRFDALPIQPHAVHGTWNYTLHPRPVAPSTQPKPVGEQDGPARRRQAMLGRLVDRRLIGMAGTDLQQLAAGLAPAQDARTQQRYAEQRGGRARRAAGKLRGRPLFDDAARLLITLVYQRQVCPMTVLADLLEVTDTCIGSLIKETREVLEDHGHTPGIASVRFATAHDLLAFLDQDLRPARTAIIHTLSDPTLTGISRQDLHQLTQRLTPRQAAHAERLTQQRRRGPRQPGTRGGVFPQKISNSERVLLAILHLRKLCTLDVLADALGDVCRSAIGNAVRETRPLLEQDGRIPPRRPSVTAPPPNSSPPEQPAATHRQLDSLRLHKRRNVTEHLPEADRGRIDARLARAFNDPDPAKGLRAARALASELDRQHPGAAASLREGLEEMFTVRRLGLSGRLCRTLSSTNPVESMISTARSTARNVKRRRDGQMVRRWVAAGMLNAERSFRRIKGCKDMPVLVAALARHAEEVGIRQSA